MKVIPPSHRLKKKQLGTRKYFGTLTDEHKEFFCSQKTLELWVGKTLAERAALFNDMCNTVRITRRQLWGLY